MNGKREKLTHSCRFSVVITLFFFFFLVKSLIVECLKFFSRISLNVPFKNVRDLENHNVEIKYLFQGNAKCQVSVVADFQNKTHERQCAHLQMRF